MSLNYLSEGSVFPTPYLNPSVGNLTCASLTTASQTIAGNLNVTGTLTTNNANVTGLATISGNLNLPNESVASALYLNNSNNIGTATLNNGQLLIGATSANPASANLTAGNSISILNGANSISVSTVQDISPSGVPTFTGLILTNNESVGGNLFVTGTIENTNLGTNSIVQTDGSHNLSGLKLFDGQLAIGASAGQAQANNLSQGAHQSVTIANSAGNIALDCAQDIRSSANPSFNNMTLNGTNLNLAPCSGAFTIQPQSAMFGSGDFKILAGAQTAGSNGQNMRVDAGVTSGGGNNGALLIGYDNAVSVDIGRNGQRIALNGSPINIPFALSASQLVATNGSNNLVSAGNLIYPTRATMWGDERLILSGSAFTLQTDPASIYCGYAFQSPALNGDSTSSSFYVGQGAYTVNVLTLKNSNQAIFTVYIDGVSIGTFDTYNVTPLYNVVASFAGINITGSGRHTLTITVTGKNGASTGFILPICKAWVVTATDTVQVNT